MNDDNVGVRVSVIVPVGVWVREGVIVSEVVLVLLIVSETVGVGV